MSREYDDATLHRLQKIELMILKDFMALCEKHQLTWFSFAGTAIGAIRHKGFIPWDDDIDVCLPREDYEKFLKLA
jgi:lipopolysaccharide cholinephosphotransferase